MESSDNYKRMFRYESNIKNNKLYLLLPNGENEKNIIQDTVNKINCFDFKIEILENIDLSEAKKIDNTMIIIGNLSNNKCIRDLYYKFLCVTDCWYPGSSGYEIRTLTDPFGNGNNAVLIGYSDIEGLKKAVEQFLRKFDNPIPYMNIVNATRLPIPENEVNIIKNSEMPEKDWQICRSDINYKTGYLAYLLNDKEMLERYINAWGIILKSDCNDERFYGLHLFMPGHIITWRLLDSCGMIPEDLDASIISYLLHWAGSNEGVKSIDINFYTVPDMPRQNHGLLPALALLYLYDYLSTYFEVKDEWKTWKDTALKVFEPYDSGSWKPMCDGLCHGWWLSQLALCEYGFIDHEHKYFKNLGARKAAECAVAVVNNTGWMPSAGDSDLFRAFPGYILRAAAAYYHDPEYEFVNNLAPEYRRNKVHVIPGRMFDTGLKGKYKDSEKIKIIPLDKLIYNSYCNNYNIAKYFLNTVPDIPLDKCFDKLSVRMGWHKYDDYLLIDGLGTKSSAHSYSDAMCILDYECFGFSFIVQEDTLLWPEPENHSGITIVKNGESGIIPSFAEITDHEQLDDGSVLIIMRLNNISDCDWVRKIKMDTNHTITFDDQVLIKEDGDYAIEDHFRIPGKVQKTDRIVEASRNSKEFGTVLFTLKSNCNKTSICHVEELPMNLFYRNQPGVKVMSDEDDAAVSWKRRYGTDNVVLSSYKTRCTGSFKKNERIEFTHSINVQKTDHEVNFMGIDNHSDIIENNNIKSIIKTNYNISDFHLLSDNRKIIVLTNGEILLFINDKIIWKKSVTCPIYDICCANKNDENLFLISHGNSEITALNEKGDMIWHNQIIREPTPYPWWELDKPYAVTLKTVYSEKNVYIIAGCGDMQIRMYDINGKLLWMRRYEDGIPALIQSVDLNNDGIQEIIVGGDIICDTANCRIYDYNGNLRADLPVESWTSILTSLDIAKNGLMPLIACGANHGRNLLIYEINDMDSKNYSYKCLFEKNLGGCVTGTAIWPEDNMLCASTSQGFILNYNYISGKKLWSILLSDKIKWIIKFESYIYVFEDNGNISRIDKDGHLTQIYKSNYNWNKYEIYNDKLYLASERSLYCIGS